MLGTLDRSIKGRRLKIFLKYYYYYYFIFTTFVFIEIMIISLFINIILLLSFQSLPECIRNLSSAWYNLRPEKYFIITSTYNDFIMKLK